MKAQILFEEWTLNTGATVCKYFFCVWPRIPQPNWLDMLQFASKIYIDIYLSSRNIVGTPNNELCTEDVGL